jgi:hypothetical protein
MRGSRMAESLVRQWQGWRPLEPDAGNAAEGSEGPVPDWRCQPCDFPRMAFLIVNYESHESTRMIFEPDIRGLFFVIPSEVEGSLDISVRL